MKMSESSLTPFWHWGKNKSKDAENPDVLNLKVTEAEPFDLTYSVNIRAEVDALGEHIIPLHNYESANKALLVEWTRVYKAGKIKNGSSVVIHTWLGVSTRNPDKPIRRWKIISSPS